MLFVFFVDMFFFGFFAHASPPLAAGMDLGRGVHRHPATGRGVGGQGLEGSWVCVNGYVIDEE
jgi:hypothetical protein